MIRALFISLLLATPAAADPTPTLDAVLDRYQKVCGPAMTDPQIFVDGVPTWAPAGTYRAGSTAEGQHYKMNIASGEFFDTFTAFVHGDEKNVSCSTHYGGLAEVNNIARQQLSNYGGDETETDGTRIWNFPAGALGAGGMAYSFAIPENGTAGVALQVNNFDPSQW